MTIDEIVLGNKDVRQRLIETALDSAWSALECAALNVLDGDTEWMDLGDEIEDVRPDLNLLLDLELAGTHPEHDAWVREIAEL